MIHATHRTDCGGGAVCGAEPAQRRFIDGHTDIKLRLIPVKPVHSRNASCLREQLCPPVMTLGNTVNLYGKDTYIIGARSIDRGEYPINAGAGCASVYGDEVKSGITAGNGRGTQQNPNAHIHVSFDVDSMDSGVFPSTGYRMPTSDTGGREKRLVQTALTGTRLFLLRLRGV